MPSPRLFLLLLIPSFLLISIFSSSLETVPPSNTLQHVGDGFRVTSPDILVGTECEPVVSELIVENTDKKEITLLSLSSTTSDIHLPLFDSKTLQPGTTESLKVVYLPNKPGPSMTTFTLLTSSTPLTFPLYTLSQPSPLNLHPTTITSIGGETVTKLFSLKGIFEVMSYEGSTSSIIVQCNEEGIIQDPVFKVDVKIFSNLGEKNLGWITLKLIPEGYDDSKTYIIPLTTVTVSDLVLPEYLDFGILTSPKDSATLPIKMYNPFPHDLKLSSVKSDKSEFKVLKSSHTSSILPSREEREVLVIFDLGVEGFVEGEIEVSGNFTSKTVKVRGRGKWGGVAWRDEDIIIKKSASAEKHSLEIFNVFKDDVLLHNVTSACSGVEIQEYEKVEKGHMQFWNVNFLTKGALNISNPITDENTDCGIWVTTALSRHWVPIFLYDGKLTISPQTPPSKHYKRYIDLLYYGGEETEVVVVDFGGLGGGGRGRKGIWVRNENPVGVELRVGGEIEGLRISPGHVNKSALDIFNLHSHSNLITSSSNSYLTQISVLDVRFSPNSKKDLEYLYDKHNVVEARNNVVVKGKAVELEVKKGWERSKGNVMNVPQSQNPSSGLLLSTDGRFERTLKKIKGSSNDDNIVIIPPGGEVRLDVEVWTGEVGRLGGEGARFIGTGLEFTTPEETFKVAVTYESVMGELEVGVFDFENYFKVERGSNEKLSNLYFTPTPKLDQIYSNLNLNTGITPTPNNFPPRTGSNFFSLNPSNPFIHKLYMHRSTLTPTLTKSGETIPTLSLQPILRTGLTSILNPPSYDDTEPYIDLVVTSTFNSPTPVQSVTSCNPWFQIDTTEFKGNIDTFPSDHEAYNSVVGEGERKPVARVYHILRCGGGGMDERNMTFVREVMFWECAKVFIEEKNEINRENCAPMIKTKAETAGEVEVEKRAYTAVLNFLNTMKEQRTENAVTSHQLTTWKDAKNAWYEYEKYDLNIIATGITVTPEVSEPPTSPPLIVTSRLSIPKINLARHEEVVFNNTRVGSEGIGYIYVENPTADPITVSIVQPNNDEGCWIQAQKKMTNSWYTGGSWFMIMQSDHTPILQAGYGSSVRTPPGTPTMKSVHGISMLLRGCGRRCGVKGETTTPTALFAPITPISTENEEGSMYRITKPQPFAVSFDAFKTVMLEPYQVKRVGPLFFKPWGQGDFNTDLYIKNDITGLEKVTLRGRGVSNFLAFSALPQSEGGSSSDVISWEGEKMLRFEPGLPTYDGSAHVTKFIRLSNQGGHPIHIQHIELQSQRNPSASLIFTFSKPFGIFNLFPPFDYEYLVPYMEKIKEFMGPQWGYPGWGGTPAACQSRGYRIVNCEAAQTDFTLENEEYIDIEIQHHPECGEPLSYTHLNVNMAVEETFYGRPETGLYVESRAFKVGHAASEADMEYCISSLDVLKYQLRYVTVFITCLFIFMAFFYLYFVSLDVLYRHDYMLRVEATWQKPIISCYDELQSDLKHITSTNPDITQLDLWVKTKVKDMMSTRTTPPTRAVPQPKLVISKRFFGNLENHDEDTDFIKATLAPVGVDVDNANHNTAYASSPATRKFTTALKSSSWRAHLAKSRGDDPNPIGCMPPSAFPAFFANMKASYHTSHLATNPNNSKSVTFRTSSSSFDDEEGEEGAGAGTPPRLVTGSSKSSLKKHPSSSSSHQVGNSGYVRSTSGSLSKEERRALAVEQQRQALAEKEARREEDEILKRAAAAKKKLKKEQEEEAKRQEILAKIKGEEEFLAAQRLTEEEAALKILEERQRQEDEEEQSAIMAAKKESLKMEKERIEREKALADERKRVEEEAREAKRSKLLARSLAEKEAAKKLKEEARLKRETELKKNKAEKKAKKLELELKKEQEKQLNKVKALIIKQKGVAEVQWLIAMSLTNEAGIKGVFTSPSDVARFCILHSDFELRREANMDFIVMKSLLPPTNSSNPPPPPPGVTGNLNPTQMMASLPPLPPTPQPLPPPPPGMGLSPPRLMTNKPLPSTPQPSPVGIALPNHSVLSSGGSSLPFPSPPPSLSSPLPGTGNEGMSLENLLGGGSGITSAGLAELPRRSSSGISNNDKIGGDTLSGSDNFDMMNLLPTDIADFVMEDNEGDLWNSNSITSPTASGGLGRGSGGLGGLGRDLGGLGGGLGGLTGSTLLTPDSLLAGLNSTSMNKDEKKNRAGSTVQRSDGNGIYKSSGNSFFE